MYRLTALLLIALFVSLSGFGQGKTIRGTVSDDANKPIPGATVQEKKRPANTVTTDENGNFTILLKEADGNELTISNIGYVTQTISIAGLTEITVKLITDDKQLDDVVVIGYGQKKKITNTGSVSSITGAEIRESPTASLQNALVGRLPGLFGQQRSGQPGSDAADIHIRGISSYNSSARPLIIIDDIEATYGQLASVDPNEIESLSILKDASTTAIYGVKGANGVVLVRTKRGQAGKAQVNVTLGTGVQTPTIYFDFLPAYQDLSLLREQEIGNRRDPIGLNPELYSDQAIANYKNHTNPYDYPDVNWIKEVSKPYSSQHRANIDIRGGTDFLKYFISGGYLFQDGVMKDFSKDEGYNSNYYFKRYNFRSNLDIKATKSTTFQFDMSGNFGEQNAPYVTDATMIGGAWGLWRQLMSGVLPAWGYPVTNPDGSYGASTLPSKAINPVGLLRYMGYQRNYTNIFNINVTGKQKLDFITKGLSLNGTAAYITSAIDYRSLYRSDFPAYDYNSVTNGYTLYNANKDLYRVPTMTAVNATVGGTQPSATKRVNLQTSLTYNRKFGDHAVDFLALYNQTTYISGGNSPAYIPENFQGYTGRLSYNYREKYMVEFVAGYNGTDRFKAKNKYGFFPAVSAGWNISEENLFKKYITFIDNLKVSASWGKTGSDVISSSFQYLYEEVYNRTNNTGTGWGNAGNNYSFGETHTTMPFIRPGSLKNDDVRWEVEEQKNLRIEMTVLKKRLETTFELFDRYRYDILDRPKSTPDFAGLGSNLPAVNLGQVSNKGFEMELAWRDNIGKLSYFVRGNYSYAKNKILFSDEVAPLYPAVATTGRPIGQFFGYEWTGTFYKDLQDIETSVKIPGQLILPGALKFVDQNKDGIINDADRIAIGNPNRPNTYYGFSFGAGYKNFTLSVVFQGTFGSSFYTDMFSLGLNVKSMGVHLERWTPANASEANFYRLGEGGGLSGALSTYHLRSADYLRLKNLELGYSLPARFSKKLGMNNIRIAASGANLFTWFKLKIYNIDPENTSNGTSALETYPQQKLYNASIALSF